MHAYLTSMAGERAGRSFSWSRTYLSSSTDSPGIVISSGLQV